MRQLTTLADRMLSRLVPKATAAACGGCTTQYHVAGPCPSEYYSRRVCCQNVGPANTCITTCHDYC
jgi:hypothetical protein